MSVANLQAYALAQGIEKPYAKMSQSEQTLLRYNYLMSVSADAQGDFAKTSDSFANQLKILQMKLESAGAALGEKLLPPLTKLLTWITENLDAIQNFAKWIGITFAIFKSYQIINGAVIAIQGFIGAVKGATIAQTAFNAVMALNPITLLIMAITALVGAIIYLWNTNEEFRQFWINAWENIKQAVSDAVDSVVGFFNETLPNALQSVKDWASGIVEAVNNWVNDTIQSISNWYDETTAAISDWFTNIINGIANWYYETTTAISDWASSIINSISSWASDSWNSIKQWFSNTIQGFTNWAKTIPNRVKGMINDIINFFKNLPQTMYDIGYQISRNFFTAIKVIIGALLSVGQSIEDFFVNLWDNITTGFNNFLEWLQGLPEAISTWLDATYQKFVDWANNIITTFSGWISNTWNNFIEWGDNLLTRAGEIGSQFLQSIIDRFSQIPETVWGWLTNAYNKVTEWGSNVWSKAKEIGSNFLTAVIEWFSKLPERVWTWLSNTVSKVIQFGRDLKQRGMEAARGLWDSIVNVVETLPQKMLSIGGDIVRGLWNGITGMGSWLWDNVTGFFSGIVDGAKDALGIHSPSRVMRDEVGKWIPAGVGVGIEEGMPQLDNIMKDSMGDLSNAAKASVTFDGIGLNDNSIGEQIIAKLEQLINKDVVITGEDGQELMRFLAPYQSELEEYSYTRNVKNAY